MIKLEIIIEETSPKKASYKLVTHSSRKSKPTALEAALCNGLRDRLIQKPIVTHRTRKGE